MPEVSRGRTQERYEHGVAAWFGNVESPLVVSPRAIRLRDTTIVALADGELRAADLSSDGVIRALAATPLPQTDRVGVTVAIDPTVPYRTAFAVLETLRRSRHTRLELQVRRDQRPAGVWLWLPTERPPPYEAEEELRLTTTITDEGLVVGASGGVLAPGCERVGTGSEPTIARRDGRLDLDAYARCLARVKEPFSDETILRVTAVPSTPFQEIVAVMAASAQRDLDELFPDVLPIAPISPDTSMEPETASPTVHDEWRVLRSDGLLR